jgi:long-chain acyl-CoA synthetase
MNSESLPEIFRATAKKNGEAEAIVFAGRTLNYAMLDLLSDRAAGTLAERGITKGDRVGLYCPNSDAFAIAYLGIIKSGAAVVPVNLLLNPKEIAFIFNDAEISALIYHEVFTTNVAAIKPQVKGLKASICIGNSTEKTFRLGTASPPKPALSNIFTAYGGRTFGEPGLSAKSIGNKPVVPGDLSWSEVIATEKKPPLVAIDAAEDLAAILYTSGTTGRPKGAMLTHRNLATNTRSVRDALKLEPGSERMLVVLPMFHAFAATAGMLAPLMFGGAIIPLPRFEPASVAEIIEKEHITLFLGVPSMFIALLHLPKQYDAKFAPLKFCASGGAALPVAVMEAFEKRFGKLIYEGDGPTECSPVTCVNPIGGKRKPGTVGKAVPGVEMKIMDENGRELPHGTIGEICVRGANVMKGYWRLPEETKESFFGEWFRTGDLGTEDDEGYFSILDRRKDIIIVNGMNIYPRMIEEVISRAPGVRECAVIGDPHPVHGEIPVAYVSTAEGKEPSAAALRAFCLDNLGRHEVPRKFIFLPELPKNASGKILKRELRRQGEVERGINICHKNAQETQNKKL